MALAAVRGRRKVTKAQIDEYIRIDRQIKKLEAEKDILRNAIIDDGFAWNLGTTNEYIEVSTSTEERLDTPKIRATMSKSWLKKNSKIINKTILSIKKRKE